MKNLLLFFAVCFLGVQVSHAQKIRKLDASPLDISDFRPDGNESAPIARIIYSRPQKKDRVIFGELVPYGKLWRMGANQSTEINVFKDLNFDGKTLKEGTYTMFAIPGEKEWTIIFNSMKYSWGAYGYDEANDVLRMTVPSTKVDETREAFGIAFGGENGKGKILLAWDNTEVSVDFTY